MQGLIRTVLRYRVVALIGMAAWLARYRSLSRSLPTASGRHHAEPILVGGRDGTAGHGPD